MQKFRDCIPSSDTTREHKYRAMPVLKDTGPPVPGTLRVVVIKANGLRANAAGGLTSPMVRLL